MSHAFITLRLRREAVDRLRLVLDQLRRKGTERMSAGLQLYFTEESSPSAAVMAAFELLAHEIGMSSEELKAKEDGRG